jgi:hypothetical protein
MKTKHALLGFIATLMSFHLGPGGIAAFADIQGDAADIVVQMDKAEKTWKPTLQRLESQLGGSPERQAAIAQTARRAREFLELTATIKREAEKIRRGDTSEEKINLLGKYIHNWKMKLNELSDAVDKLSNTH